MRRQGYAGTREYDSPRFLYGDIAKGHVGNREEEDDMKLGVSTYSFVRDLASGKRSVEDVIRWVGEHGGEHVEIVPFGFTVRDNPSLIKRIRQTADEAGVELSNYLILSNFTLTDDAAYRKEIDRVRQEVDVAVELGVRLMRHDVAWKPRQEGEEAGLAGRLWPMQAIAIERFEESLPRMAAASAEIADYANQFGITTMVENHLFLVQASDRVQRLIQTVDRTNFRTTLDIGNFLCVDESPVVGVAKNLSYAKMVHLKDFYIRPSSADPGEGWFRSAYGTYLRGAIFGHGDIDVREVFRTMKAQAYAGYASLEFEGMEDPELGVRLGLANAKRLWDEV